MNNELNNNETDTPRLEESGHLAPQPGGTEERGVLQIIRAIKSGELNPGKLSSDERRLCVQHFLYIEGLGVMEIALILHVSDRTIRRDRKVIHESNAIKADPELAGIYAGRLHAEMEACQQRIRKISRDQSVSASARIDAERQCFDMLDSTIERLQSLGILPTASQAIQADITLRNGHLDDLDALSSEIDRMKAIKRRHDTRSETSQIVADVDAREESAQDA
ncbi:MAG: hypothetical protein AAGB34_11270 [Planctomycetota bacterium]